MSMRKLILLLTSLGISGSVVAACAGDDTTTVAANPNVGGSDATILQDTGGLDVTAEASLEDGSTDGGNATATRGEYLVKHLLLCGGCHNPPTDGGAFLGGGRAFDLTTEDGGGAGTVYAANLTPSDAGLGSWKLDQIVRAITKGTDDQGRALHPIMPYTIFGNLTAEDALSIALYLKTLTPADNVVPDRTVDVDAAPPTLDDTKVPHTDGGASADNGRYLAELGCIDCHTARVAGQIDLGNAFAGGRTFGTSLTSSNLTPDPTGIQGWTPADLAVTLANGTRKGDDAGASLCPRMPTGPDTLGGLTAGDRADLGAYFTTLPPIANGPFETDGGLGAQCN
jgi:mono/diheme cytochrome c family protein